MDDKKALLLKLGKRIVSERTKLNLSSERLAYEVGISKGNLSEIERGLRDARFSTIAAIADGLQVSISKLLKDLD